MSDSGAPGPPRTVPVSGMDARDAALIGRRTLHHTAAQGGASPTPTNVDLNVRPDFARAGRPVCGMVVSREWRRALAPFDRDSGRSLGDRVFDAPSAFGTPDATPK